MISKLLIPYLGNKKLYSFEDAVQEIKQMHNSDAYEIVLAREDFDFDVFFDTLDRDTLIEVLEFCSQQTRAIVAKHSMKMLLKSALKIDYWRWWEFIFERVREIETVDIPDFLNILNSEITIFVDIDAVTCCIANIKDPKETISILRKTKGVIYKKLFFTNERFLEYFENTASNAELIEIGLLIDDESIWNKLFEKPGFKEYLTKTMPFSEAIKIAEETKVESLQNVIISRADFSNRLLEDYANFADHANFKDSKVAWQVLFQTEFYKADKSLKLCSLKKHQDNGIPSLVLKRASVIRYLNALDAENSIKLLKKCKSEDISKYILSRKNIKFEIEKLFDMLCIHDCNNEIWSIIFEREEMKYLETFFDDELIALAKKYDLRLLWKYVVSKISIDMAISVVIEQNVPGLSSVVIEREDFGALPEKLIIFAHKAKSHDVWKKILAMPEVRAYLES